MAHSHHHHREHQVSHRRVHHILKDHPDGAKHHAHSHAFSKVTSKSAAVHHDGFVAGHKSMKRYARGGHVKHSDEAEDKKLITKMINKHEKSEKYARGGKVKAKSGHQTNIAIVLPHRGAQQPMAGAPPGGAMPMPAPGGPPPGMPPGAGGPPPGMPPGMPMHKRGGKVYAKGGKVIDGEANEKDLKGWAGYAKKNSYFRGGAASGVGREEKAEHEKHKKHK